jgi:hypothetical protein
MVRRRLLDWSFICLIIFSACGERLPQLEGIDLQQWQSDKNGCNGQRAEMLGEITNQKDKLLSLSELNVIKLLGRPDQNELYTRNQKFFYYFIDPGPACQGASEKPHRLMVRFNAMGLAQEVLVE